MRSRALRSVAPSACGSKPHSLTRRGQRARLHATLFNMNDKWKTWFIKSAGFGAGFALALACIVGAGLWYATRPTPQKPWNQTAIAATAPPGFCVSDDGKRILFSCSVANTTKTDYRIESSAQIRVMARGHDGTLSLPMPAETAPLQLPAFIPAGQKGMLTLSLALSSIPEREALQTAPDFIPDPPSAAAAVDDYEQYHERVRAYLQRNSGQVDSFVLFDEANRYPINLPRWSSEPSKRYP